MDILITDYEARHKEAIKRLNEEWLKEFFVVEPIDEKILSHPEDEIIRKGGRIFYAWKDSEIVGTVSLISVSSGVYELSKMAVTARAQGFGFGKALLAHAIKEARSMKAHKMILYSNTKLLNAIALYRKFGFEEVRIMDNHYDRCDIMMEKALTL